LKKRRKAEQLMFLNQENNGICAPIAVSMLDMKTSVQLVTTT